ncbi:MAG TPA: glycosyltransferase family 4 protein [Cyclobacteriaceae bacterium]|nr:glycosyltransferase family 4 protein [Cyclobacteriaceae bacterium]
MKTFIILTQYYPPETGAPQNRLHSLSKFLIRHGESVQVVTALPNYPKNEIYPEYRKKFSVREIIDGVAVYRTWIFVSRSRSVLARLLNYFSFVITSFFALLRQPKAEYVICESPPLFLGLTAVFIAKIKGSRLVFNVSDLWPESAEKLQIISSRSMIGLAYKLEKWIYNNSYMISGQTKGIVDNILARFPSKKVVWFPNGVDFDFFEGQQEDFSWRKTLGISETDFVLLYAGIIGHAQGLDVLLRAAEMLRDQTVKFVIVGDGPEKENLVRMAAEKSLGNVIFQPNLQKAKIPSLIKACDAYIVPLKKLDLFKGAIPSKLFEPLALGKPILLGVDGEARQLFIEEGKSGLYFEPEDAAELAERIKVLISDPELVVSLGEQGQRYVKEHFDRQRIHEKFLLHLEA